MYVMCSIIYIAMCGISSRVCTQHAHTYTHAHAHARAYILAPKVNIKKQNHIYNTRRIKMPNLTKPNIFKQTI